MINRLRKKRGHIFFPIFAILTFFLLYILFMFIFSKYKMISEGEIVHDSLVASNLAALSSKNIDLDLLGQDPNKKVVEIKDPYGAFNTFEKHLKYNFDLNNYYEPENKNFIKSKVTIEEFIVYNVNAYTGDVTEYKLNKDTMSFSQINYSKGKGNLKTPKGNVINVTTIHSKIKFNIETMLNNIQSVSVSEDTGTLIK